MSDQLPQIVLTFAVPQRTPMEFAQALPQGYDANEQGIVTPDGVTLGVVALPQDDEFTDVVMDGATHEPSEDEERRMREAPMLVKLYGPGGSEEAAARMLQVGAAVIRLGAAGVLVDNSGLGHGAADWLTLAEGAGDGGTHWAFIATVRDDEGGWSGAGFPALFTAGMHVLGHRDVLVTDTGDAEHDWFHLNNFCGYLERSGRVPVDGDVLTVMLEDEDGLPRIVPIHRVRYQECRAFPAPSPMHNPYGLYVLEPLDPDDPTSMDYLPSRPPMTG